MSGKSYQVIFQHFNSLLPKVSTGEMKCFVLPQISESKKKRVVKVIISEVVSDLGNRHPQRGTCPFRSSPDLPGPTYAHDPFFRVWALVQLLTPMASPTSGFLHLSLPSREYLQIVPNVLPVLWVSLSLKATNSMSGYALFPVLSGFLNYSSRKQRLHGLFSKSFVILSSVCLFKNSAVQGCAVSVKEISVKHKLRAATIC